MNNRNGYSLVELQVSVLVASILALMIGSLAQLSHAAYRKTDEVTRLHSEAAYALKFIRSRVRENKALAVETASTPWIGDRLVAGNHAFGIYRADGSPERQLVYLDDKDDESDREVLMSAPDPDLALALAINGKAVTVTISGERHDIPFSLTSTVKKRLP